MKRESKIKELLEKFLEAETNLKEEKILAEYFQNEDIKPEWEPYRDLFVYFEESHSDVPQKSFYLPTRSLFYSIQKYAAVAVVLIIGTLFYYSQNDRPENLGTYDDPEVALEETKKVFDLISYHLNSPKEDLKYLTTLEETKTKYINKITP